MIEEKKRDLNADLIRTVAVFSVLSVHFLLNNGFYSELTVGTAMLLMCMFRSWFMTCVPLFLILTGYLMNRKTLSRSYYRGITKTLVIYVLASIACLVFKKYVLGYEVTIGMGLWGILDFSAANYAWYIEMYIGLFLMIPFLNLAYRGLTDQRQKRILLLTMLGITMLPKLVNNFNFVTEGWWMHPSVSKEYNKLVPGFFTVMYPVSYYFIGAYLKEYGCRLGKKKTFLLFALCVMVFGAFNFYRSDGGKFIWGNNSTWGGENVITAVLLFSLLLQLHPDKWRGWIRNVIKIISSYSLGIYLLSWIFDRVVYDGFFKEAVPIVRERFIWYFPVVGTVFVCSLCASVILYLPWNLWKKFVRKNS